MSPSIELWYPLRDVEIIMSAEGSRRWCVHGGAITTALLRLSWCCCCFWLPAPREPPGSSSQEGPSKEPQLVATAARWRRVVPPLSGDGPGGGSCPRIALDDSGTGLAEEKGGGTTSASGRCRTAGAALDAAEGGAKGLCRPGPLLMPCLPDLSGETFQGW